MKPKGNYLKNVLNIYLSFWLGILGGGVIDYFRGFSKPGVQAYLPFPWYELLLKVIEVNFTFSVIIFLLGINRVVQRIVIVIISFIIGEIVFTSGFFIGLIGILPHGLLEIFGFSLIAYAGQNLRSKDNYVKPLLLGYFLLIIAAFIGSFLTVYILQQTIGLSI
ncbi:stage II sporulation protein M [Saccharolobus shibatae]|uniref:Stage II sporulation protein M n=1 Tax=Saccharolobus shibatae TaxID=2286 RepID=A0A8F5BVM2_9CREN|nr:stage II sporulation protein M [Saccharolobus shibatae]QXJ32154.1 hypothetical protein J5U21_01805 [Saccharolobus shibatae]